MRIRIALTAFFCMLACCALIAQTRAGQGASSGSRGGLLSSPASSSGRTSAKPSDTARRGIFDIATSSENGKKSGSAAPASGRATATASPFGTTSNRTRSASARRWKTNSKIADCIRAKAIPSNTNLSFSGTITGIITDGRYVILTMFDSVETVTESGTKGDVPVTYTVVLDAESVAGNTSIRENAKKSFTVDSNYAYLVWNDSGCTVRAVENALTEPDPSPASR
ncbi:MAG: hypothetical protein IKQ16_08065 [Lentisphaeria bacterium]|nr:hypothetical protein [Lentisphaeria bacterium]